MVPDPMTSPDTTEAVRKALDDERLLREPYTRVLIPRIAEEAIAADRKALAEHGYAIVKIGEVPPWMKPAPQRLGDALRGICMHGRMLVESPSGLYSGEIVHRTGGTPCDDLRPAASISFYRLMDGDQ
jgi:hypothetical protein